MIAELRIPDECLRSVCWEQFGTELVLRLDKAAFTALLDAMLKQDLERCDELA
jgi:hypothetical protein